MLESIEDFRIIISIYKSLSLTQSSSEFQISPASMSKRLRSIESRLGKTLFYRSTRKFSPTEEGEFYYQYALEVIEKVDSIQNENSNLKSPSGVIKLSTSTTFARLYLMPLLEKFLRLYPKIKVDLILSDQVLDIINEGIDIAIRIAPLQDSNLITKKIGNGRKVLCCNRAYLKKFGAPQKPDDLRQHNCLVLGNDNLWTFKKGRKEFPVKVRGNLKVNFGEMLGQAIKNGIGISFLSYWLIHDELKKGQVIELLPDFEIKNQPDISIVYPHKDKIAYRNRLLIDFLSDHLKIPV